VHGGHRSGLTGGSEPPPGQQCPILLPVAVTCARPRTLRLGHLEIPPGEFGIMAVINATPDSFFDRGATRDFGRALEAASAAVAAGADIIDIGGVKAGPGDEVSAAEEIRRVAGLVVAVRERHPGVVISVDTWRAEVGDVVAQAGAGLLNDAWGGVDPRLAEVAASRGVGLVCSHAGGLPPRTRPHRPAYADVAAEVAASLTRQAERAVAVGVPADSVLVDPAHDFGKNTRHSLELTRRLGELTTTGWPVLVAVSNKDFIGETLGAGVDDRAEGTIAALAVSAWLDARVFRVHDVRAAKLALQAVTAMRAGWLRRLAAKPTRRRSRALRPGERPVIRRAPHREPGGLRGSSPGPAGLREIVPRVMERTRRR
jgi:dihydropteroate synthase